MGGILILETTFLIDLEREARAESPGSAHRFLRSRARDPLFVSAITAGELASGASLDERPRWEELLDRLDVLPIDREVCWRYGRLFRYLKDNGLLIGTNDLWIAATAVANALPLATRNEQHFRRVPDLQVIGYT